MTTDARAHPRYDVSLSAEIVAGPRLVRCGVENLSAGGCRLRPTFPIPAGASIRLRITSAAVPFELSGDGLVAWSSGSPPYLAGVRFAPELEDGAGRFLQALLGPVRL